MQISHRNTCSLCKPLWMNLSWLWSDDRCLFIHCVYDTSSFCWQYDTLLLYLRHCQPVLCKWQSIPSQNLRQSIEHLYQRWTKKVSIWEYKMPCIEVSMNNWNSLTVFKKITSNLQTKSVGYLLVSQYPTDRQMHLALRFT